MLIFNLAILAQSLIAIDWEIVGPTSKAPVHFGALQADLTQSVGYHTVQILEANQIPYIGIENGIHSILNTPTGEKSMVIESNERMRVYGWCYHVDGIEPGEMPDKVYFKTQNSKLKWFFAYTVYDKGNWIDFCTPAYLNPLP